MSLVCNGEEISWKELLREEKEREYFKNIIKFVESERSEGKDIFPENSDIFNAFKFTPFDQVRVVILGQDPYHGVGQAHGLCFSVQDGVRPPPSLQNIFKELRSDLGFEIPKSGNLEPWAKSGVFLLNTILTVEKDKPLSHFGRGWETFTDFVIKSLSEKANGIVFILWGSAAAKKEILINAGNNFIIKSAHPSPLSAHRGFLGSKPFSKTNDFLRSIGKSEIDWRL